MAQGDKVLQIMDLRNVCMKFSLPAYHVAALAIGTEVRMIFGFPSPVILPAQISYIAPNTASFSEKWTEMMVQQQVVIKAKIAPRHLRSHAYDVTDGVTGRAYVQLDKGLKWPTGLEVRHQECNRQNNRHNFQTTIKITNTDLN